MTSTCGCARHTAPKKHPPFLVVLGPVLAAGAIISLETHAAAEAPAEAVEAVVEAGELAPLVQAIDTEEMLRENARLRAEVQRLENLLAGVRAGGPGGLEREVLRLRAEVDRYRAALSIAVEELDALRAAATPSPGRFRAEARPDRPDVGIFTGDPDAVMNPETAEVSGSVHNANGDPVTGYLVLTLLADGRDVGGDRLPMRLAPRTVEEYSTTINGRFPAGPSYRVRATWETENERTLAERD